MKAVKTKGSEWSGVVTIKGKPGTKPIKIPLAPVWRGLSKAKRDMYKAYLADNPNVAIEDLIIFALDRYLRAQGFDKPTAA